MDGTELAHAVQAAGVRQLYADHGWASRVAVAAPTVRIPPANLQLDDYGFKGSASMLLPPFQWTSGTGVLLEPVDAEGFAATARAHGLAFSARRVGELTLFVAVPAPEPGTPLPASALTVTASRHPERAGLAVDGDAATRWSTAARGRPATGSASTFGRREWSGASGSLRAIRPICRPRSRSRARSTACAGRGSRRRSGWCTAIAGVASDSFTTVRAPFRSTSRRPRSPALRLVLPAGDPTFDWSIHELAVYGAD